MLKCNIINGNTTHEFYGQVIIELEDHTGHKEKYALGPTDAIDLASCIQKMAHEVSLSKKR